MKILRVLLAVLVLTAAGLAQTRDLGQGQFANEEGAILVAVDAGLVESAMKKPYVPFILFLGAKDKNMNIVVEAKDVVMVYKGVEYHLPALAELRDHYTGEIRDLDFYRHLGKEGIISSWVRIYDFPDQGSFFPPLTAAAPPAIKEAHLTALHGFASPIYFKNPGFAKGDALTIKVRDRKDPAVTGQVDVVLK